MNPHQLKRLFPNASASVIAANSTDYGTGLVNEDTRQVAKLERNPASRPLEAKRVKETDSKRLHLRIVSVRKREIDPDNLSAKWLIDSLRYAGVIRDDAAKDITLEVSQRKVATGEEEHTHIEIWKHPNTTTSR